MIKDLQNQIKKLGDFYHPRTTAEDIIWANKNLVNEIISLTDKKLIEEVMSDLLCWGQFVPKVVMFGMHCKCCVTAFPSVKTVKIFNKSSTHL